MEILFFLVLFSVSISLVFLVLFFWAVEKDQFQSMDAVPWNILDEDQKVKNVKDEGNDGSK